MFPAFPGPDLEKMFLFSREMASGSEEDDQGANVTATLPLSGYELCPVAVPAEEAPQWPKSSKCFQLKMFSLGEPQHLVNKTWKISLTYP